MNNKGLTLIELIALLVILGIIATISIFTIGNTINDTRVEVDSYNLITLNTITLKYAAEQNVSEDDIFDGLNTDVERIEELVRTGYLFSLIEAQQNNATFVWDISSQEWILEGGEVEEIVLNNVNYDFSEDDLNLLLDEGSYAARESAWDTVDGTLQTSSYTELFIPINQVEYIITVEAQISEGTSGGYGVFFETTLKNDNPDKDYGYVFQFDRGFGEGSMIVRTRENGKEDALVWQLRSEKTDLFPTKTDNPEWWSSKHVISVKVELINEETKMATFILDEVEIGSLIINSAEAGETIYTGFRVWTTTASFYSLMIE